MTASFKPGFLDDTVRVLLALRTKPVFNLSTHPAAEEQWYESLYQEAEKLWDARERHAAMSQWPPSARKWP